jgi:mannosyltransferase
MEAADVRTARRAPEASDAPRSPEPIARGTRRSRLIGVAVAVAVVAGVALRFWTTSELWLDEALTVNIARLPLRDIPETLRHDGAPPLYYFLLHGWMRLFGEGDLAVRSLSAVFGIASLPVVWLATRRLTDRTVAWTAVVLMATSPFGIRFGTEGRMYTLLTLLALLGYLALVSALDAPTRPRLAALAVATGLLLLTHYWALYLVGATGVLLFVLARRGPHALAARSASHAPAARRALGAMAIGSLLFVPWAPSFVSQLQHTGTPWADPATFKAMVNAVSEFAGGGTDAGRGLALIIFALAGLAVFGRAVDRFHIELDLRTRPRGRGLAITITATLLIGIVAGLATQSAYAARYTAVVFGLFIILIALGTTAFADRRMRYGVIAVAAVLGLWGGTENVTDQRTQAAPVAAAIATLGRAGDVVAYCPDQLGPAVDRLLRPGFVQLTYPRGRGPQRVDWVDYEERLKHADPVAFADRLDALAGPHHDVFLAWSGGYRTHQEVCEKIVGRLAALRETTRPVQARPRKFFEYIELNRFQPRQGAG